MIPQLNCLLLSLYFAAKTKVYKIENYPKSQGNPIDFSDIGDVKIRGNLIIAGTHVLNMNCLLKEMVINKFENNLNTVSFVKYLDEKGIKYTIEIFS